MKKICVITGTRADYGHLYWVMKEIEKNNQLELQIVAGGMHLSPEFGETYKVIEKDGFKINAKVEMNITGSDVLSVSKSVALGTEGFAESYNELKPDLVLIVGDRFEMLAAAQAALIANLPIAHIYGGDTTEGAFDEAIRHSITKMSHLHFVSNKVAAKRVIQLGENPEYIFNYGSPGLDHLTSIKLLEKKELEESLDFKFQEKNILCTYHPVTLEHGDGVRQLDELLRALDEFPEMGVILTKANADTEGSDINARLEAFADKRKNIILRDSLGIHRYLSAISQVDAVVGNSSSGLYEAPSFNKPTVNIGDRQKGRVSASSVIHCRSQKEEICGALKAAFELDCSDVKNPYGDGQSSAKIVAEIAKIDNYKKLIKKHFFDLEF